MILLDTHIWIWWVQADPRLAGAHHQLLSAKEAEGLGVSVISCWEVAKLVEVGRLALPIDVGAWIDSALAYPGMTLLDLSPRVAVESTRLPSGFHKDPADQIIVATARVHDVELVTMDSLILSYPHVRTI